jgi:serine/threonine protein kinase
MSDKSLDADGQSLNIDQLIADFKARTKAGEQFSFEKLLAAHPEHTAELTRYFKQWKESETPPQPDKAEAEESSTETSAPGKISFEDATAHTMIQGTGDSESSLTRDFQQPNTEATSEIEISKTFSRYEIQKVLGQGAMGAVYLARDTQLDRDVALKIPKFGDGNGVDEEELLARFYREARASATLRSPNICPVYDVGEIDGQHYITMAFIEGRPLKDYTKSKKTHSEKQIITTIRKLALGLAEAHEIGVIHRDLKPANIMIDRKGEPVVMDFGLARRSSSDDVQVTQSGAIIGTPAYMAPEQVEGDQSAIDHQVDIYALGVIMYELITGEMPFKGNLMSLLQQIALNNPTKPSELRPDIDPRLEAICLKMIAGDREQRYQSMTDVANDLQEVLRNPDERHKQAQAKKKGAKPKSLPSAKEESNPALISLDRSKSSAERMRAKQGKSTQQTRSSGPPKQLLIAGGIGGVLLLLGIVFFTRPGKQDEQITQDDPGITNSVDGKTALTAKVVNGQLDGELPNSHSESEPIKNPPPTASNSQRYALTFPEPTSVVKVNAPFRLDEDFTLEAWVSEGDSFPTANEEDPPDESILDLSFQMMLNLVHDRGINQWSFATSTKLIPGYQFVICRGEYTNKNIAIRGERNHIAAVFENGEIRQYVDGKRLDIVNYGPERPPAQGKPPAMVRELLIGNTRMAAHVPFRGLIEGVRYSKGARYNEDFMPPAELTNDSNTEALYLFKEGQGDILKDYSGNGYDGKIIDAKWVEVEKSSSQTIDLLADLVPTTLNSKNMAWQKQDGILAGNSSASRKKKEWVGAIFPQEIDGDFDLELELKQSGFAPLQIDLPLGDKQAIRLHLGGLGSALMVIDGKEDRDAAPEHSNKDAKLKRNVWQLLTAKVRHNDENVSVDVALDGERIGLFSGPRSRITLPKWVKPDPVHVKFAGTGVSGILELEFRRALVHIDPPAVMQIEKTSPK